MPLDGGVNVCTKFRGHRPIKIWEGKNIQNLAQFRTTIDFDCKYLWNGLTHRQAVSGVINYSLCCVEQKKLINVGPLTTKLCLLISTCPTLRVCAFSDNFRLWSHISLEQIEISMKGKWRLQLRSIQRRTQKNS